MTAQSDSLAVFGMMYAVVRLRKEGVRPPSEVWAYTYNSKWSRAAQNGDNPRNKTANKNNRSRPDDNLTLIYILIPSSLAQQNTAKKHEGMQFSMG